MGLKKLMMIIELMIIYVCIDRVIISNVGLREKIDIKRQYCLKKILDLLYIKLVGRKIVIMVIIAEFEYVKVLFNFLNL